MESKSSQPGVDTEGTTSSSGARPETEAREQALAILEEALGHRFSDRALLERALTHRSHSNEKGSTANYERLEFLGDAVLALVTARWLYSGKPDSPEGELTKLKSFLVSTPVLAAYAQTLDVAPLLSLGVGEDRSGGRRKESILADVVEALLGAVYLEAGFGAAQRMIEPMLEHASRARARFVHTDPKTQLQEYSQGRGWGLPEYHVIDEAGPDHQKVFTVECRLEDRWAISATGRSKKDAAQRAAALVLDRLTAAETSDEVPR